MKGINWRDYISSDSKILFGKPVIKGTRIPVELILEKFGKGETIPQLLEAYPKLDESSILACLVFAAKA